MVNSAVGNLHMFIWTKSAPACDLNCFSLLWVSYEILKIKSVIDQAI